MPSSKIDSRGNDQQIQVVVGAVIYHETKLLIAQRRHPDVGGGLWEFPGGKVEPEESESEALVREIQEELELEISVHDFIAEQKFTNPSGKQYELRIYLCRFLSGQIRLHVHSDYRWVSLSELSLFSFSEPDVPLLPKVVVFLTN